MLKTNIFAWLESQLSAILFLHQYREGDYVFFGLMEDCIGAGTANTPTKCISTCSWSYWLTHEASRPALTSQCLSSGWNTHAHTHTHTSVAFDAEMRALGLFMPLSQPQLPLLLHTELPPMMQAKIGQFKGFMPFHANYYHQKRPLNLQQ